MRKVQSEDQSNALETSAYVESVNSFISASVSHGSFRRRFSPIKVLPAPQLTPARPKAKTVPKMSIQPRDPQVNNNNNNIIIIITYYYI
jgi:hypothetical protein